MVGAAAPQSQPQPPSAEEEALKRNTDCVYFLASPLTCKKGSECDFRHSDFARVNPRDCWFWLNGNCLNPKCGFRHPPLDGLLGTQMPSSTGSAQTISQTMTAPFSQVVYTTSKPGVPCIFFQNGFCVKGDWCPFLHTANSIKNKASLVPVTATAIEPSTSKKVGMSLQEKKVLPTNQVIPIKGSQNPEVAGDMKPAICRNELSVNRRISGTSCINELPYDNSPPVSNGNLVSSSNRVHQPHLLDEPGMIDNKDAGDVSREPSPGFDVLVDDEGRDSEFYQSEDQYGMSREYEARNEYDMDHFTDYSMIAEVDNDRRQDLRSYDSRDGHRKGQYSLEQNRASSERMSAGSSYLKRRPYDRAGSRDELDVRHRFARNKQPNGLRSVISHDHARDKHVEDRSYEGLHRHKRHISVHETSLSSRLRGRIRLPQRSSSPIDGSMVRGTDDGRLSPIRARFSSNQGRMQERLKGRVEEASSNGWNNHRGLHLRRDMISDNNTDFAGPKSLAELKNRKNAEPSKQHVMDQHQLGKRKYLVLDGDQQNGNDVSFEGPKPLEEILKRKRGETTGTVGNINSSTSGDIIQDNNQNEGKDKHNNELVSSTERKEVAVSASVERTEAEESEAAAASNAALQPVCSKLEGENGTVIKSVVEQESEAYEQRDEFDSEQDGGEDFDLYDGDDGEEEYIDDDDDDFAKKMGVMHS